MLCVGRTGRHDQMQAFLYRHLVPAQELVLAPVTKPAPLVFEVEMPDSGTIKLPLGGEKMLFVTRRFRLGIEPFFNAPQTRIGGKSNADSLSSLAAT